MFDADGSADPDEIPRFVAALVEGADVAKGTRYSLGGGSDDITLFRDLGNRGLNMLCNILLGTSYTDLCYGYNAFWADVLPEIGLLSSDAAEAADGSMLWGDGFEIETVLNCRWSAAELAITEVPSHEKLRVHGASNLNAVTDGIRVLKSIMHERRRAARPPRSVARDERPAAGRAAAPRRPPLASPLPPPQRRRRVHAAPVARPGRRTRRRRRHPRAGSRVTTTVAVVICAYTQQRWDDLQDSVESAKRQPEATEVVVVIDHEPELLARRSPLARAPRRREHRGPRPVRRPQHRRRPTDADVVAFLDDDATADADWLGHMLTALERPRRRRRRRSCHPGLAHATGPARIRTSCSGSSAAATAGLPDRRPATSATSSARAWPSAATRSCSPAASAPASAASATSRSAARRPNSASASPRPVLPRASSTNPGRTSRTGSPPTA